MLLSDSVPVWLINSRKYTSTETPRSRARAWILEATSGSTLSTVAKHWCELSEFAVCRPPRSRGGLLPAS